MNVRVFLLLFCCRLLFSRACVQPCKDRTVFLVSREAQSVARSRPYAIVGARAMKRKQIIPCEIMVVSCSVFK